MNYGQLKTLVMDYLEVHETSFAANIGQFVRQAEETICRQVQLPELIQTSTSFCIVGNPLIPLPTDYLSTYYLAVIVNGVKNMMLSKDQSFIREVYADSSLGTPRFFALFSEDALMVGPTPDTNYQVEMSYYFFPPSLTEGDVDANETWLSKNAENALLFGTIIQGYTYLKGDQDVIKQYTDMYQTALAELKVIGEGRDRKDSYRQSDRRLPV